MVLPSSTVSALGGPLCAALSSVTWAIGTTSYSVLSRRHPAFVVNFQRAIVAFVLFVVTGLIAAADSGSFVSELLALPGTAVAWLAVSTLCSYAFADVLFLWSTRSLGTPAALAIASTYPIWAALAAWGFRDEPLTPARVLGLLLAVGGTTLVILSGRKNTGPATSQDSAAIAVPSRLDSFWTGFALALVTSFLWAMNAFAVASGTRDMPVLLSGTVRMFFAALFSVCIGFILFGGWFARGSSGKKARPAAKLPSPFLPWVDLKPRLWIFVVEGFGGALLYTYGLGNTQLAAAAVLTSLAPVISIPLAWRFANERVSPLRALGVVLVMMGVWLVL